MNKVEEKRTALRMSRAELTRRSGVSDYLIRKIESGSQKVSLPAMAKICDVLEINLSDISQAE